jgi:hypothetical protein
VSVANKPEELALSFLTGVVGFVGAFAITLVFSFINIKLVKCEFT